MRNAWLACNSKRARDAVAAQEAAVAAAKHEDGARIDERRVLVERVDERREAVVDVVFAHAPQQAAQRRFALAGAAAVVGHHDGKAREQKERVRRCVRHSRDTVVAT